MTGRREFYFGEYNRLVMAERIVDAYNARARAESWTTWAVDNPALAQLLAEIEKENATRNTE